MDKPTVEFLTVVAHGTIVVGKTSFPAELFSDGTAARMNSRSDWVDCDPKKVVVDK